ncbi:MAG: V-type ATP synthase subunit I [Candidatus Aenigmarchaeota archaeon]|nr:V-type ATP synthase subunit I [Candidatus Aenigmarchaeota archaeon]
MFYPERMSKVTVAASKAHINGVINTLYELRALHIEEYMPRKEGDLPIGSPLEDAEQISELLVDIHSLKRIFPYAAGKKKTPGSLKKFAAFVKKIKSGADSVNRKLRELDEKIKSNDREMEDLEFLSKCGINDPEILTEYKTLQMVSGYVGNPEKLSVSGAAVFLGNDRKNAPVVVFFRKENRSGVAEALEKARFNEYKIRSKPAGGVKAALDAAGKKRRSFLEERKKLLDDLESIGKKNSSFLNGIEESLLSMIQRAESPLKFAAGKYVFIVQGWIPEKNAGALAERIREISPNIYLKVEEPRGDHGAEAAPTKMKNPKIVNSFEFFLNLYSLPKYDEIDPSFLIFLTFPLFYGMMLGDIGYGIVLLVIASVLRFRVKKIRALMDVTILSALSTIFFGFIFGEFFGSEQVFGYHLVPYLHRLENVNGLIVASAALGFFHVNAGIILGFVNELRSHGAVKAVTAKLSWLVFEAGLIIFALNSMKFIEVNAYIPGALMAVSVIGLLKGEGFRGIIEIPSLIANILSYLRLTAIGLASASLAIVVNKMAGSMFAAGGFLFFVGVIVLVIGHTINLALGIIDAFLQSLRLHYVEMFTKFYHGEGKPYKPFGAGKK